MTLLRFMNLSLFSKIHVFSPRDALFEFHFKFWNTASIGIPVEVYYEVDRLLNGITAQQKGTTARWYSNKTSLVVFPKMLHL